MKKKDYLPIRELMEAFGTFTVQRVVNELERLTRKDKHPRSYLNGRVTDIIHSALKAGLIELASQPASEELTDTPKTYRWRQQTIRCEQVPLGYRLPPTPAPPINLDDHTQQPSDYWRNAARKAK